jgi:hypothetical protein
VGSPNSRWLDSVLKFPTGLSIRASSLGQEDCPCIIEMCVVLRVCLVACLHNAKIIFPHLPKVSRSNPAQHFGMTKEILSHFCKLLTGGTKVVG